MFVRSLGVCHISPSTCYLFLSYWDNSGHHLTVLVAKHDILSPCYQKCSCPECAVSESLHTPWYHVGGSLALTIIPHLPVLLVCFHIDIDSHLSDLCKRDNLVSCPFHPLLLKLKCLARIKSDFSLLLHDHF